MSDDLAKKYFGGGVVSNDARNRMGNNIPGDGFNPNPQPKPMMPQGPPNQTENYDLYDQWVDKYNEDIQLGKDGGKVEKKALGGKIGKSADFTPRDPMVQAQMDVSGWQTMKDGGKAKQGLKKGKGLKNKKGSIKMTKGQFKKGRKPVDLTKKSKKWKKGWDDIYFEGKNNKSKKGLKKGFGRNPNAINKGLKKGKGLK